MNVILILQIKYIGHNEVYPVFICYDFFMSFSPGPKPVSAKNEEEDEFEKEMASELSATMNCLATAFSKGKEDGVKPGPSQAGSEKQEAKDSAENDSEFYDDVYFDSDDSEGEGVLRLTIMFKTIFFLHICMLYLEFVVCIDCGLI